MEDCFFVGIDIGVTLVKVGIYDTKGNCVSIIKKNSPGKHSGSGVFIQSGEEFFSIIINALKEAVEKSNIDTSSISAIAFSGQMGGAIGVNKDWNAVTHWSNPIDTRYTPYISRMLKSAREDILKLSGTNYPYFAPKVLWWKHEFPDLYRNSHKFMLLSGFIAGKMGDISIEDAFVDKTYLQMTGIADIPRNRWSLDLCSEFKIDMEKLPGIVDSSTIIGKLNKSVARECNLPSGIPLVAGAGDKPAGYIGAGVVEPGTLIDESASFAAFSLCSNKYIPDLKYKTLENIPSPISGQYFPTLILIGSGLTHEWFKNIFGEEEQRMASMTGKSPFQILDEKANSVPPGSEKLFSIGLLGGRGYPSDPAIRGMWINYSWSHKKEHFYRSLLESFAYEYGYAFKVIKETYPDFDIKEVLVIGGGSRSDLWNQIKSDVIGLPYIRLTRDDFTLLGDVLIAGYTMGIYKNLRKKAKEFTVKTDVFLPDEKNHNYYKEYVERYESIFERVRDLFIDLNNIPDFN